MLNTCGHPSLLLSASQVSDSYFENLSVKSFSAECYAIKFVRILSRDHCH